MTDKFGLVQVKSLPPYTSEQESQVYLDPSSRARLDVEKNTWLFDSRAMASQVTESAPKPRLNAEATRQNLHAALLQLATSKISPLDDSIILSSTDSRQGAARGAGVDVELVSAIPMDNETFIERNFSSKEVAYCRCCSDPQASFAGRWSAKEAVIKTVSSFAATLSPTSQREQIWTKGSGAELNGIEILASATGAPIVSFISLEVQEAGGCAGGQGVD